MQIYRESDLSEAKVRVLQCLGAVKTKALIQRVLDLSISKEVKQNDTISVLASLSLSKEGQDMTWKFFKDNIKLFQERYPVSSCS
jgi:hypothetical protein